MVTVGYGDITPINPYEKVVCIFTILISCGVFAYSMNSIGTIFSDLNAEQREVKKNMQII